MTGVMYMVSKDIHDFFLPTKKGERHVYNFQYLVMLNIPVSVFFKVGTSCKRQHPQNRMVDGVSTMCIIRNNNNIYE